MNRFLLSRVLMSCLSAMLFLLAANTASTQYCDVSYGLGTSDGDYCDRFVLEGIDNTSEPEPCYNDYSLLHFIEPLDLRMSSPFIILLNGQSIMRFGLTGIKTKRLKMTKT